MLVNQKSILLATTIALSCSLSTQAQPESQEITINFEGWVGDREFVCGESYEQIGTAESTMTPNDILEGIMRISVKCAITRPAEFIEITFEQKMQES